MKLSGTGFWTRLTVLSPTERGQCVDIEISRRIVDTRRSLCLLLWPFLDTVVFVFFFFFSLIVVVLVFVLVFVLVLTFVVSNVRVAIVAVVFVLVLTFVVSNARVAIVAVVFVFVLLFSWRRTRDSGNGGRRASLASRSCL